jgi:peptide/nickel transport system permease protein
MSGLVAVDLGRPRAWRRGLSRFLSVSGKSGLLIGGIVLVGISMTALLADWIAPHDPYAQDLTKRFVAPCWLEGSHPAHRLGTDGFGRDYLSRLIFGARVSLLIGLSVAAIAGGIGTVLGMISGYFGGKLDIAITFLISTRLSLPVILVVMAVLVVLGSTPTIVVVTLGLLLWEQVAVVLRTATQQVRQCDFVTAARLAGSSHGRIMLAVVTTAVVADAILLEAALSFLGFGIQEPIPSWGLMLAKGREQILFETWLVALPGAALLALVFSICLVGDGLRDMLTPDAQ